MRRTIYTWHEYKVLLEHDLAGIGATGEPTVCDAKGNWRYVRLITG